MCSTTVCKDVHSSISKLWIKIIIKIIGQIFYVTQIINEKRILKIKSWLVCGTVSGSHPQHTHIKKKNGLNQFKPREAFPMLQEKSAKFTLLFPSIPTSLFVLQFPFPAAAHVTCTHDPDLPSYCPNGENSIHFLEDGITNSTAQMISPSLTLPRVPGTPLARWAAKAAAQCPLLALGNAISPKCPWSHHSIFK